ncbi:hypothetical protein HDV05_006264 [Chytridiales sp. JEL 0842]|nr:hypothetical protein HDV05_006264 [Chytridiales sp. JEL 0842]
MTQPIDASGIMLTTLMATYTIVAFLVPLIVPVDSKNPLMSPLRRLSHFGRRPFILVLQNIRDLILYLERKYHGPNRDDNDGDHQQGPNPLRTFIDLFSPSRLEPTLMALLPASPIFKPFLTGVYSLDLFLSSALSSCITAGLGMSYEALRGFVFWACGNGDDDERSKGSVQVRIDYLRRGCWCPMVNERYLAVAWLISKESGDHVGGTFRMAPFESEIGKNRNYDDDEDEDGDGKAELLEFNMVPSTSDSEVVIVHEGFKFKVYFDYSAVPQDTKNNANAAYTEPSILIQRIQAGEPTSIKWMKDWLNRVSMEFVKHQKSNKVRSRYEYDLEQGTWKQIHALHSSRGLASVALDRTNEQTLANHLRSFNNDRDLYKRLGTPYKLGILLSGPPGTGKTSLLHGLSSEGNRDMYVLNLKEFTTDKSLQNAFSRVPKGCMIVLEDVDAQSRCVWDRRRRRKMENDEKKVQGPLSMEMMQAIEELENDCMQVDGNVNTANVLAASTESTACSSPIPVDISSLDSSDLLSSATGTSSSSSSTFMPPTPPPLSSDTPTLSTILSCLDGHSMNENVLIVMTTNHPEVLDPAVLRPGRMDLHLELGCVTAYQCQRMFENVMEGKEVLDKWEEKRFEERLLEAGFVERVVAPCEVMRIMLGLRHTPELILDALVGRCKELLKKRG